MTLSEAIKKIENAAGEVENDGFNVSLIGEVSCVTISEPSIIGSGQVRHNPDKIESDIIAGFEEDPIRIKIDRIEKTYGREGLILAMDLLKETLEKSNES